METQTKRFIYADNAATTPVSDAVLAAMQPYFQTAYGNPSSIYRVGRDAQYAVEDARERAAKTLGCLPQELYFTSCGSESDNWALRGLAALGAKKGHRHIVTSAIEHHAILHTCQALEKEGFTVTYVPVDAMGLVSVQAVADAIQPDTAVVSIMFANNEIGTLQPIPEIAKLCRARSVPFHTDAVQAFGHVPIDVHAMGIDALSISGHKIHAQKGVGCLYLRRGLVIPNLICGGGQERGRRAGTENVPAIVGLATAMELALENMDVREARLRSMRDRLIDGLLQLPRTRLNGDREQRLAGNCNLSFEGVEGESLLLMLDMYGICASSGSACTSGSLDPSHVLLALGLKHEVAHGSLRLSLSDELTEEDIDYMLEVVPKAVARLREMSPLWERICRESDESQKGNE